MRRRWLSIVLLAWLPLLGCTSGRVYYAAAGSASRTVQIRESRLTSEALTLAWELWPRSFAGTTTLELPPELRRCGAPQVRLISWGTVAASPYATSRLGFDLLRLLEEDRSNWSRIVEIAEYGDDRAVVKTELSKPRDPCVAYFFFGSYRTTLGKAVLENPLWMISERHHLFLGLFYADQLVSASDRLEPLDQPAWLALLPVTLPIDVVTAPLWWPMFWLMDGFSP